MTDRATWLASHASPASRSFPFFVAGAGESWSYWSGELTSARHAGSSPCSHPHLVSGANRPGPARCVGRRPLGGAHAGGTRTEPADECEPAHVAAGPGTTRAGRAPREVAGEASADRPAVPQSRDQRLPNHRFADPVAFAGSPAVCPLLDGQAARAARGGGLSPGDL